MNREPRRILMTADTVGGVWNGALLLTRGLAQHGIEVALAMMGAPLSEVQKAEAAAVENLRIFESDYSLEWMDDPWDDIDACGQWLLDVEAETRPDVIHLNEYAHGALPWQAPCLVVAHSCVYSWYAAVKQERPPTVWETYRARVSAGLRAAAGVTSPTRAMLGALEPYYGPFRSVGAIHNGTLAEDFVPARKAPFVLSVGRVWDEAKNIAAVAQVARALPWEVYVIGQEEHPDGGDARLDQVKALGRLPQREVAWWMGRAAVFAAPAKYEPFGFAPLEAALAGCALVLGDIPTLREIWADSAVFVPPGDDAALRSALLRLIEDEEHRTQVAERVRAQALQYPLAKTAAEYVRVYRQLLEHRAARTASENLETVS